VVLFAVLDVARAIETLLNSVDASDNVDQATRSLFAKRADFLMLYARAYLAGRITRVKGENDERPGYDTVCSKESDIDSVNWKSLPESDQKSVLEDSEYQEKAALILQVLWNSKFCEEAKKLAKEFAVFKTIFVANDGNLTMECLRLFGDVFERELLKYWDEKNMLSSLFDLQLDRAQVETATVFLKENKSPFLHLLYLHFHLYADAAGDLSWRVEAATCKRQKQEYACLGKMAIRAARLSPVPVPDGYNLNALEKSFDFALLQLANHELIDDLKDRNDCVSHKDLITSLVHYGSNESIAAAADFVKAAGECHPLIRKELGIVLWEAVILQTPWLKVAKIFA